MSVLTYKQLRHAICAITLLSMALKGQRNLLEGAFQHYHQAISAVMTSTSMPSGSLLYLHFILLLYDICCANQNVSPDGGVMWSQHFQQLGRLAYSPDSTEINELQAYLLWYTLYLDGQSCLAGNPESGAFVQAYQKHGSVLPAWLIPETAHQQHNSDAPDFTAVFGLSKHMCSRFAELSQLALQMRKDVELGTGSISQQQRIVTNFRNDLYSSWSMRYPALLSRDSPEAGTRLPGLSKTAFDFVSRSFFSPPFTPPSRSKFNGMTGLLPILYRHGLPTHKHVPRPAHALNTTPTQRNRRPLPANPHHGDLDSRSKRHRAAPHHLLRLPGWRQQHQ